MFISKRLAKIIAVAPFVWSANIAHAFPLSPSVTAPPLELNYEQICEELNDICEHAMMDLIMACGARGAAMTNAKNFQAEADAAHQAAAEAQESGSEDAQAKAEAADEAQAKADAEQAAANSLETEVASARSAWDQCREFRDELCKKE